MIIVLYEDFTYDKLYPITLSRPACLVKTGVGTLLDRIKRLFLEDEITFKHVIRDYLVEEFRGLEPFDFEMVLPDEEYLFIKANLYLYKKPVINCNEVYLDGAAAVGNGERDEERDEERNEEVICFKVLGSLLQGLSKALFFKRDGLLEYVKRLSLKVLRFDLGGKRINYLFDLVENNLHALTEDISYIGASNGGFVDVLGHSGITLTGSACDLHIKEGAKIYPGVHFITESGPILVEEGVIIKPFSLLEGPCYIGKGSILKSVKIGSGTTIGNYCKVGGELENTIIHDYSNKSHEGFIGHSYIGEYVNMGALTTTSNLKNNYSEVRLLYPGENEVRTGLIKAGSYIGDHSKLGIGSLLTTGTVLGFGVNIYFGVSLCSKYIPSFIWGSNIEYKEYLFDKFLSTCHDVMLRRLQMTTDVKVRVYEKIFDLERENRRFFLERKN